MSVRCYYDFHIHSCLSPCADMDMTPHSIAGMSYINGLNAIAVCDHNSARNIRSVMKAAEEFGITVVPGIEAESAENIHLVCLFSTIEAAEKMGQTLEENLPPIKNRADIFGKQCVMNENDEIVGEVEKLLINATALSIEKIKEETEILGGVCIAAHVDREKNGIVSIFGCVPREMGFSTLEISNTSQNYVREDRYRYITSSDAHYLTDIAEKTNYLELESISADEIIKKLK